MAIHIIETTVRDFVVPAGKKSIVIPDIEQAGFAVQKTVTGNMTYIIRYRNEQGKQRQEKIAKVGEVSVNAARAMARSLLKEIEKTKGARATDSYGAMSPVMDDFFYKVFLPRVKLESRSYETHAALYRNHISPVFARMRLTDIEEEDVVEFANHLKTKVVAGGRWKVQAGRTLADGTVKRILVLLRHIFNTAKKLRRTNVRENPTDCLKLTTERHIVGLFLNAAELRRLLAAAEQSENTDLPDILRVLIGTGLRRSNVMRMQWSWFDETRGTLSIPASEDKGKKGLVLPLSEGVQATLRQRKKEAISPEWVFCNPKTGKPYHSCRNAWVKTRERAGLPTLRVHDLRHTYASMMLDSGSNLVDVQVALGHANVSTTQVYMHVSETRKRQRADVTAQALGIFA